MDFQCSHNHTRKNGENKVSQKPAHKNNIIIYINTFFAHLNNKNKESQLKYK